MDSTDAGDHELRQTRLSSFGRVLALVALTYVAVNFVASIWLQRPSFNGHSVPLVVAIAAFAALWLLLRGAPRTPRFVRVVELSTLSVGTAAFSTMALFMSLIAEPHNVVRSILTFMLLGYAVYVPSTARRGLSLALSTTANLICCARYALESTAMVATRRQWGAGPA